MSWLEQSEKKDLVVNASNDALDLQNAPKEDQEKIKNLVLDTNFLTEINKIKTEQWYEDPLQKEWIWELIKKWNYFGAIKEWFRLIWALFWWNSNNPWYEQFRETGKNITFSSMDINNLVSHIEYLQAEVKNTSGVKKKLHLTKILSDAKNTLMDKKNPNEQLKTYDRVCKEVKAGQIILLNKKSDTSSWANLLRSFEENNPVDYTHSVLVSQNEKWEPTIIHSTMHKESEMWAWVEEIPLKEYLEKYQPSDILVLDQEESMKQKSINFARSKLWKWYDTKVAIAWWLGNTWVSFIDSYVWNPYENDVYNCVELIAQSYSDNEKIKRISHPNDFLDFWIFTPTYMAEV